MNPAAGVRYELVRASVTESAAVYEAVVTTPAGEGRVRVVIDANGARVEGTVEGVTGVTGAHLAQLLAIAKTIGKRSDEGWPRRIHRWRSPGVR